ncbi:hypothetical protein ACHRVK_11540 [Flavobacterium plurextorum]|uniref:hypothetical protein n=1 Tax=Flavobacterium plurextorum TaxID=1114867 RepID=UPI0037583F13
MKKTYFTVLLFIIFSCADNTNLGNDYYYLPEYEAMDIGYPNGAIIYKSFNKNVFKDVKISANVKKAKSNINYIIALQIPKNSSKRNYFIIDKRYDKIYGPLEKIDFFKLKSKMRINLNFDDK